MESDLQGRLERQCAFWRRENRDRPVIGPAGTYFSGDTIRVLRRTDGWLTPCDIDPDRVLEDCESQFLAWRDCAGDLFWTANVLWLTPDHGASFPDLVPVVAKVRAQKPVLVHGFLTCEEMQVICASPARGALHHQPGPTPGGGPAPPGRCLGLSAPRGCGEE